MQPAGGPSVRESFVIKGLLARTPVAVQSGFLRHLGGLLRYRDVRKCSMNTKERQYKVLVEKRKACRECVGLANPAEPALRQFDSCEIGPWSRLHGDLDAQLMIVGQDWGGVKYYKENEGLDKLTNPTMRNLEKLLHHIGIRVSVTSYAGGGRGLFLTNAVLCLKTGGLQARIEPEWCGLVVHGSCGSRLKLYGRKWLFALGHLPFMRCSERLSDRLLNCEMRLRTPRELRFLMAFACSLPITVEMERSIATVI